MRTHRPTRLIVAALAIPLLLTALTGCGRGDADASGQDDGSSSSSDSPASDRSFDEYQLDFASCMRDKGVDMPDPDENGSIQAPAGDGFMEAAQACQDELGLPPAAPGGGPGVSDEEQRAEWLEIAACFRENGVDVPDPGPGEELAIPADVAGDVFETCAPQGVRGSTGVSN
ncbi:hypothetical protein [Promicromonospora kroppenstedtii]|uniref:hypothetical protein n=1 Tax=Promicromonospora kroppenstedtii TaxID=440482 RepID=UPI000686CA5F|nr:hypothetical protein [Promicromonospora kroppenstedtii]